MSGKAWRLPSSMINRLRAIPIQRALPRGYTLQLFLFTLLPITLLAMIVAIGSQNLHHDAMSALVGDRNLRAIRAAADSLAQEMEERQMILSMAAREWNHSHDLHALSPQPQKMSTLFDGGLAVLDANAERVDSSGMTPETLVSVQYSFSSVREPTQLLIRAAGKPQDTILMISAPADSGLTLVGVVRLSPLIENVTGSFMQSTRSVLLVVGPGAPEGGLVILYESAQPVGTALEHLYHHAGVSEVMQGQSGILYDHTHQNGQGEQVIVYTPVERLGWGMVVEEPWEEIASPVLRSTQSAPLVMAPILLLSVLALWYGAQSIVQPLNRLEKQSTELARGDFEAVRPPVGGIREIQNLQAALIDMAEKLYDARQSLRSYIGAMTAGIENERRSLARELHDDTIQSLIALNQRIQLAGMRAPEASKSSFTELQDLVQTTLLNLRRIIRGLRPIYLEDLGLVTALQMLVQETEQSARLPIQFQVSGQERRLPPDQEMSLYRMTQESLNNVVHHAQAPFAEVRLAFLEDGLLLAIQDQGKGFRVPDSPSEFSHHGHFGLLGLQERAELIGAHLEIHAAPGQGTRVQITLPAATKSIGTAEKE